MENVFTKDPLVVIKGKQINPRKEEPAPNEKTKCEECIKTLRNIEADVKCFKNLFDPFLKNNITVSLGQKDRDSMSLLISLLKGSREKDEKISSLSMELSKREKNKTVSKGLSIAWIALVALCICLTGALISAKSNVNPDALAMRAYHAAETMDYNKPSLYLEQTEKFFPDSVENAKKYVKDLEHQAKNYISEKKEIKERIDKILEDGKSRGVMVKWYRWYKVDNDTYECLVYFQDVVSGEDAYAYIDDNNKIGMTLDPDACKLEVVRTKAKKGKLIYDNKLFASFR